MGVFESWGSDVMALSAVSASRQRPVFEFSTGVVGGRSSETFF
jgi:hypothetical protein